VARVGIEDVTDWEADRMLVMKDLLCFERCCGQMPEAVTNRGWHGSDEAGWAPK